MMYDFLASYYDDLVQDDEATAAWLKLVREQVKGKKILETACGSGDIAIALAKEGYRVEATDLSRQMIEQATKKEGSELVSWSVKDMRDLPDGKFDAVLCFCDSINYLLDENELCSFFHQCFSHLASGGVLLFDMHSQERLHEFEEEYNEAGQVDGIDFQWTIESEDDRIYQTFAFYGKEGTMHLEQHVQRVYDPKWVLAALDTCGFETRVLTDFVHEGIKEGEKQFYICRRRES